MASDITKLTTLGGSVPLPAEATSAEHRPVDEHANLLTHGLGLLLSLLASALLMTLVIERQHAVNIVACGIYCFGLVGLYSASTLSHAFYDLAWRRFYRAVDQGFIFLLIAGSITPFAVFNLGRGWSWPVLLAAMWIVALFGVGLVVRMRNLPSGARSIYLILGWLPVLFLKAMFEAATTEMLILMFAGGAFYSVGTLFLAFDRHVRYFHALWHTFVIAGSICHYIAILLIVVE